MRIIIEIDGKEPARATTPAISTAPPEVLAAAADLEATDAGPAPTEAKVSGIPNVLMSPPRSSVPGTGFEDTDAGSSPFTAPE